MDIGKLSLRSLAEKIKNKEISCVNVANHFIKVIEEKRYLNAFIYFNKDQVLEDATQLDRELSEGHIRGRLHGVPLVIKDTIHIKGIPNTAGTPALKNFIPKEDAAIIEILRQEGAIFIGKANMHELGFGTTSDNAAFGAVRNAHAADYSPFGSSGGNGAAIGAGMAVAGVGGDTCGSITMPSSGNGICGLRPTWNRYSLKGVTPISSSRDTIGPMGVQIDDLIYLDEVMKQETNAAICDTLKGLRIGVPSNTLCASIHDDIKEAFETLKAKLIEANVELVDIDLKELVQLVDDQGTKSLFYEPYFDIKNYLKEHNTNIDFDELMNGIASPAVKDAFTNILVPTGSGSVKEEDYKIEMNEIRPKIREQYKKIFQDNNLNVIIFPNLAILPMRIDEIKEPETLNSCIRNVKLASAVGSPLVSIPMGVSKIGLPIGVAVGGEVNKDAYLLRVCSQIEKLQKSN